MILKFKSIDNVFFNMTSLKIIICSLAMATVLFFSFDISVFEDDSSAYERIGSLLAYIIIGTILYYIFLRILGVRLNTFKL